MISIEVLENLRERKTMWRVIHPFDFRNDPIQFDPTLVQLESIYNSF